MDDGALYNGKRLDLRPKIAQVAKSMQTVKGFQSIICQRRFSEPSDSGKTPYTYVDQFINRNKCAVPVVFEYTRLNFDDPLLIA
jgi:acetoacetyl-CoA synthetase